MPPSQFFVGSASIELSDSGVREKWARKKDYGDAELIVAAPRDAVTRTAALLCLLPAVVARLLGRSLTQPSSWANGRG
jgi:hypothetical protein